MSLARLSRSLSRPVARAALRPVGSSSLSATMSMRTTHDSNGVLQTNDNQSRIVGAQKRFFAHHGDHAEEKEFINAAFELFDENKDGVLVWSELELA